MSTALGRTRRVGLVATAAAVLVTGLAACTASSDKPSTSANSSRSSKPSKGPTHPGSGATPSGTGAAASVSSLGPSPTPDPVRVSHTIRGGGRVLRVTIPSSTTFRPRPAYVYLPPVLATRPNQTLPVLELLHGTPGQPADWFTRGDLLATANAFAAAHHGSAPIMVVPDINGAQRADSECIRTTSGADVETYLTRDVVAWVRRRFARAVGTRPWWVAGLSEGGICSIVLALRHPTVYSAFGDLSGLLTPQVEHQTPAQSDQTLFRGNAADRAAHDPTWLLTHRHYGALPAWFATGASDARTLRAQTQLAVAARAAHLTVHAETRPGRHEWTVWSYELRVLVPWLWRYVGPTGGR